MIPTVNRFLVLSSILGVLAACAAPDTAVSADARPDGGAQWSFESAAETVRARSCPAGTSVSAPGRISVSTSPVDLGPDSMAGNGLPAGVTFAGGWSLVSDNASFGGLSGLDTLPDGNLLTVSDTGAFVWIGLTGGTPNGTGRLSYMLGEDGNPLSGKADGDAEGLAVRDGLAFVSFERHHRIEAFDLQTCSASARAARITDIPTNLQGREIGENQGAEALSLSPAGLLHYGLENFTGRGSPLGIALPDGIGMFTGAVADNPWGYSLVGLDETADADGKTVTVTLYRSYDPLRGNRNVITWADGGPSIELARPLLVDNFEGIAAEFTDPDTLRIWLISDNNFSDRQQTLLYAFDVKTGAE